MPPTTSWATCASWRSKVAVEEGERGPMKVLKLPLEFPSVAPSRAPPESSIPF
jgi:hypothetical protein